MILHGATLIDGTGADPRPRMSVVIDGTRVAAVQDVPPGGAGDDSAVDLSGLTLLPGLIDAHTHVGGAWGASTAMTAAGIFQNLGNALDNGFTLIREVGGLDGGIVLPIREGLVRGPRVLPAGPFIAQDGGHGTLMPPYTDCWCPPGVRGLVQGAAICNSPDEVRLAARKAFRDGATHLKVVVTGGVVSLTDELTHTQLTIEEIRAAVEEAEARETYVTAHCHGLAGIKNAITAGVRCIEHGSFLDEETAALMAARDVALVPTLTVAHVMTQEYANWHLPESVVPRIAGVEEAMGKAARMAAAAGVLVGSGSDLLGTNQRRFGLELVLKSRVFSPMEAIVSATANNARICRVANDLGTVEPGKLADLIAVNGDPLAEPELFDDPARIVLVVKDGTVVKDIR